MGQSPAYHAERPRWNRKDNYISYMPFLKGKNEIYGVSPDGKKQWKITADGKETLRYLPTECRHKKVNAINPTWKYEQAPSFVEIKNQA